MLIGRPRIALWKNLNVVPTLTPDTTLTKGVCGAELLLVAALGSGVSADCFPGTRLLEDFIKGAGSLAEDLLLSAWNLSVYVEGSIAHLEVVGDNMSVVASRTRDQHAPVVVPLLRYIVRATFATGPTGKCQVVARLHFLG